MTVLCQVPYAAVFAAYGWDHAMTSDQLLESLLAFNHVRAGGG